MEPHSQLQCSALSLNQNDQADDVPHTALHPLDDRTRCRSHEPQSTSGEHPAESPQDTATPIPHAVSPSADQAQSHVQSAASSAPESPQQHRPGFTAGCKLDLNPNGTVRYSPPPIPQKMFHSLACAIFSFGQHTVTHIVSPLIAASAYVCTCVCVHCRVFFLCMPSQTVHCGLSSHCCSGSHDLSPTVSKPSDSPPSSKRLRQDTTHTLPSASHDAAPLYKATPVSFSL